MGAEQLDDQEQREHPCRPDQRDQDARERPFERPERQRGDGLPSGSRSVLVYSGNGNPEGRGLSGEVTPLFWWLMKYVFLGPLLRLMYRPKAVGLENVPTDGPAILAANHQSFLDGLILGNFALSKS